jgi:hypothetical protein
MKKRITQADIAFAYELRCEHKMTWKQIADHIGCNADYIAFLVNRRLRYVGNKKLS